MSEPARRKVSTRDVAYLMHEHGVAMIGEHPAAVQFVLGDGRSVVLYEGNREHDRSWELEEHPGRTVVPA